MNEVVLQDVLVRMDAAFKKASEGLQEMAEIFVEAVDANPAMRDMIIDAYSTKVPRSMWNELEKVGRKQMHRSLLSDVVRNRGVIRRLPMSTQMQVLDEGFRFPLLLADGDTVLVDLVECDSAQLAQLVSGSRIRTVQEQRLWLDARAKEVSMLEQARKEIPAPFWKDGKIHFPAGYVTDLKGLQMLGIQAK